MSSSIDKFEQLLNAANDVLNNWIEDGSPHDDAMISLHCAARKLDGRYDRSKPPARFVVDPASGLLRTGKQKI